ncbi:23S rRNA pseudouridine1911/1915/1917 synthase [Caloramator quimbayensis]|uniref:Pseudouridine synthase n=1 Tax=Caloramator quimbayensis TaxID=1147123 RepID=A0A1T4XNK7_9CLOT|nr:RluA family pseudouridine synthase [Caloramator quimbayensis]SKA90691.1 23S rRNA pseudouridine1911/1915/1917 synthase [Caloramator quimbayensis]
MKSTLEYSIEKDKEGIKLINFLRHELKMSTRLTRKLLRGEFVKINGITGKANSILKCDDRVIIILDTGETQDIEPQDIPIDICYEDEDILIVNKPPFMVVHPTKGHPQGTLSNAVMHYFKKTNQNSIVRLVNRLDRDTSGLVVIAKSQFAHQAMAKKLEKNEIEKYYVSIVEGMMEGRGTIDLPIDREFPDSVKRAVIENGQRAVTHYEVISSSFDMSALLIKLETGKTHQIRVHFSHIGHPIVGDTLYGKESNLINRQALHAHILKFKSIRDNRPLEIVAKIPDDINNLMNIINHSNL